MCKIQNWQIRNVRNRFKSNTFKFKTDSIYIRPPTHVPMPMHTCVCTCMHTHSHTQCTEIPELHVDTAPKIILRTTAQKQSQVTPLGPTGDRKLSHGGWLFNSLGPAAWHVSKMLFCRGLGPAAWHVSKTGYFPAAWHVSKTGYFVVWAQLHDMFQRLVIL